VLPFALASGLPSLPRMLLLLTLAMAIPSAAGREAEPTREFESRVKAYLELRKQAVDQAPKLKDEATPEEIAAHKQAEAAAIRAARPQARQGDLFTPAVSAYLKRIIRSEMSGKAGRPARQSARQGNPEAESGMNVPLRVNAPYPGAAPLSSVPPTLLMRMPELPRQLDFRFVGRDLILHDVQAGLIVDFLPNAMPPE